MCHDRASRIPDKSRAIGLLHSSPAISGICGLIVPELAACLTGPISHYRGVVLLFPTFDGGRVGMPGLVLCWLFVIAPLSTCGWAPSSDDPRFQCLPHTVYPPEPTGVNHHEGN
jgi:hypothetical protein